MRISDWSSDVCSSDLGRYAAEADGDDPSLFRPHANGDQGIGIILRGRAQPPKVNECAAVQDGAARPVLMRKQGGSGDGRNALVRLDGGNSALVSPIQEIGSASCRERVCQYV